jgi:hypothetical protein
METTFGRDNPTINVIYGDPGGRTESIVIRDASDTLILLNAFIATEASDAGRQKPGREDGFYRRILPPLMPIYPRDEGQHPLPPLQGSPPPISVRSGDIAPKFIVHRDFATPAADAAATFRPGTERDVVHAPPVRNGRMIEFD